MLELSDPLWCKLNSAHGFGEDIPFRLVALAEHWDENDAKELMHGYLIHQETCYGATYAAAPYLLRMALPDNNVVQRMDIAVFLGYFVLCAFRKSEQDSSENSSLNGLALTLESWEQTRDPYRSLLMQGADQRLSEKFGEIDDLEPPSEGELRKFAAIRDGFIALLPEIGSLCERTFHEHSDDEYIPRYLLSGIAATEKLIKLASLLESGEDGYFACSACGAGIDYIVFGDRMALYSVQSQPAPVSDAGNENSVLDFQDGEPKRADGFVFPYHDLEQNSTPAIDRLIALAQQAENPELEFLLRNFLGKFTCPQCEETCQVCSDIPR
ncbi:MAG: hypothetical protein HKP56_14645 [Anderseniella sp.]|nr:hypothetical protein [Anderseniella sp.]